jgi:hypothetical protein
MYVTSIFYNGMCVNDSGGIRDSLVPRLSAAAREELRALESIIAGTDLSAEPNCCASPLIPPDGKLRTSLVYQLLAPKHDADAAAKFSWDNIAPPRVRFFNWLVTRDRIQSKTNLKMKKIVDNAQCDVCNAREETTQHIFSSNDPKRSFWVALGFRLPPGLRAQQLHLLPRPDAVLAEHYDTLILLCC